MKINLTKKEKISFLIIGILICFLPYLFTRDFNIITFNDTGNIGDTIGGVTAPFLSFFGSILVFLALKAQIDANEEIKIQFQRQNQDQLFFRLIDNLHNRITNYSFNTPEGTGQMEIKSFEVLSYLIKKFRREMYRECILFGRQLLAKIPEQIAENFFMKIINANSVLKEHDIIKGIELRNEIIKIAEFNDRWEFIKLYVDSHNYETPEQRNALQSIGTVYFYKTPLEMRYTIYQIVFENIYREFGGFFDGYFNSLKYVLNFIDNIEDNSFFVDYLKNNLTSYEKAFIFYYIASNRVSAEFKELIKKYDLISDLEQNNSFFVDSPSKEEFEKELHDILNFTI
ncbi:putative phage abortive infection protein [Flavobacterium frigidarium]|uniref:Phage abortive infection protein n=1 Tax=Flavobacterium frigidarium TaxID=99286 RepID=A0ABV4K8V9_9FLAO